MIITCALCSLATADEHERDGQDGEHGREPAEEPDAGDHGEQQEDRLGRDLDAHAAPRRFGSVHESGPFSVGLAARFVPGVSYGEAGLMR